MTFMNDSGYSQVLYENRLHLTQIAFNLKLRPQVNSNAGENVIFREIKLNYIKVIFQLLLHQALISKCLIFGKS